VEEHFYLILPAMLVLTRKRWRVPVLLGLSLIVAVHRLHVLEFRPWNEVLFHTDIRLDGLLIPAIFAVLAQPAEVRAKMKKWLRFWPLPLIAAMILYTKWQGSFWQITFVTLLLPMAVLGAVLNPNGYLALALEWAPIKYIGRISYSLYIWQELFFSGHSNIGFPLGVLESSYLRYAATLGIAIASYHLLERPLIRLGHRLAPPATPGREDIQEGDSGAQI
jgi:peptidoglycan/LPS O-acetylase OafA/YrhL